MDGMKREHIIYISKRKISLWLWMVFLTMPHMKVSFLNQIPAADSIFNIWRLASFAIIMVQLLFVKRKVSLIALLLVGQQVFLFLVTMINRQEMYACAISAFSVISIVLFYDYNEYDKQVFLSSQLFCFEVMIFINLVTELLYPDGMYLTSVGLFVSGRNWFLGYYNNHSQYYIPALMFAWLYYKSTRKKLRTFVLTTEIFASAFIVWSGGVLLVLFGMALAFVLLKNHTGFFNYYTYWLLHPAFFLFVIVMKLQDLFRWLIDGVLGKWDSLMARMKLWEKVHKLILEAPVFGHGIVDGTARQLKVGFNWAMHAHNLLLEILYQGGVVNFMLWIMIVIQGGGNLSQP